MSLKAKSSIQTNIYDDNKLLQKSKKEAAAPKKETGEPKRDKPDKITSLHTAFKDSLLKYDAVRFFWKILQLAYCKSVLVEIILNAAIYSVMRVSYRWLYFR